ncbi:MAG: tRNA guanosine(34) transglycosylase Tgt [Acidobacteria bacterium]|nr:tRNA guanosine(34) transglycosylase Tgt [Acidobacteriota bacterium]
MTREDRVTSARAASLTTPHGVVETPAFMPVGTCGTVKGVAGWELDRLGPQMVLANTYHLVLRPGVERMIRLGGIHRLMGWGGPILTDSGGYQVFSLAARRVLDEDGVVFQSHVDGSAHSFSPESVVDAQVDFGVDVAMVLDDCLPFPAEPRSVGPSVDRTIRWAQRALIRAEERREAGGWAGGLFAIQQGSVNPDIRRRCSDHLASMAFDGYAIGGLAVGEPTEVLHEAVDFSVPMLPAQRPRYLMGVGYPEDLLHAVACGVDLFDCVLPTRSARTGKVFTSRGEVVIKNARWADDDSPLDPGCGCPTCARYSKGALRHFFISKEATSVVLLTLHNLYYFLSLMRGAREAIMAGRYGEYRERMQSNRELGPGE